MVQLSHPYMTSERTIVLTPQTFVGKVMSLLFNMPSRFITAFLPRSKHLLILWLQSPSAVTLELKKIKSVTDSLFPHLFAMKDENFDYVDHNKLWKILKEMGIPDDLTCLLRNLYAGQEATVRTGHGTRDWFWIGKGVCQDCILSPYLCNLYAEYIIKTAALDEAQSGIKIAGRNSDNLRYADVATLMAENEEPHDDGERGEWKGWLKIQHSKNEHCEI